MHRSSYLSLTNQGAERKVVEAEWGVAANVNVVITAVKEAATAKATVAVMIIFFPPPTHDRKTPSNRATVKCKQSYVSSCIHSLPSYFTSSL
ncbi:unnamed protein product [Hymenolepis diminuta]|uniref:Uncharacterized protein n=1 Tax=Hymenolepis diminuta TaxID=6216 RepID=A0A0R3SCW9_HYMDI|nr:unnamed protein product [Hymenolepis diminuta]